MADGKIQAIVREMSIEAEDIVSLFLSVPSDLVLPAYTPGAHIDLHVAGFVRQYSLCNQPGEADGYRIGVLKDRNSRGGSEAMHRLRVGDAVHVSAPRNHFPLDPTAAHSVLFAGGIGITPLISMAQRLFASGQSFEMHYCARSREKAAFVERIHASAFAGACHFYFDDGPSENRLDLERILCTPRDDVHIYTCGPKGFMDAVLGAARSGVWPDAQLHCEHFAGTVNLRDTDGAFEVVLSRSRQVVAVPGNTSVVRALELAGVCIPTSCEQGVCGTCLTRVLEGEPDHRDMYLTASEREANDQFLPCCSRSKTPRLVLDL